MDPKQPIDVETLKIGDQFLIRNGMCAKNPRPKKLKKGEVWIAGVEVGVYTGQICRGEYDFCTHINGTPCGQMSLKVEDLTNNPFDMVKIDSSHEAFIPGVDAEDIEQGLDLLHALFGEE
jgi:hypothetical protein